MIENFKFDDKNITGKCPECEFNWDKGDAFECVKEEAVKFNELFPPSEFPHVGPMPSEEDLKKRAFKRYGWSPENPVHLSHLVHLTLSEGDLDSTGDISHYQCPKCMIAWSVNTGERTDKFKVMLEGHALMEQMMRQSAFNRNNGNEQK